MSKKHTVLFTIKQKKNIIKNEVLALCVALAVLSFESCKNSVEPEGQPGTRNYTWNVDTITIPYSYLSRISGSGPDDVWAVGPTANLCTSIYHYNGNEWKTDGIFRSIVPWCIHSISRNSVWLAGQDGKIWKYNGQNWTENYTFMKNNHEITFEDIWGDMDQNVFAIGHADSLNVRKPIIIHYNGSLWNEISTPSYKTYAFVRIVKDNTAGNYYLMGWGEKLNGGDLFGLFELSGSQIKQIYEGETMPSIIKVQNKILFSFNKRICSYSNNEFVTFIENNDISAWWLLLCARNTKDIFLWVADGLAHYNGDDIKYVYKITNPMSITDGVLFDNDAFFIASEPSLGATYILRGKMNKQ